MRNVLTTVISYTLACLLLVGAIALVHGTVNRLQHRPFMADMKDRMLFWSLFIVAGLVIDQPLRHLLQSNGIIK